MSRILVIDDDADITGLLKRLLTKHGYEVETAASGAAGEKLLSAFKPDLVMCDYRLGDIDGLAVLSRIKEATPNLPVIIMTAYSDLRTAVKVIRLGAFDYITKPFIPDEILLNISQSLASNKSSLKSARNIKNTYLFSQSDASKKLDQQINLVAPTDYSVIIYGESGSGKEGVARLIHERSNRSNGPFVAMDCGAISKELAASELFGHEKGAFTGALNRKTGQFEMAEGGTLFLDEVTNLPHEIQTLLLRVLQQKTMRSLGSNKEKDIDVRIVAASNEKISEAISLGKFREDLYHRLNEFQIEVLPLRKRKDDIIFFSNNFLSGICKELHKETLDFDDEVKEALIDYPWPGNVRELKNIIKRTALLSTKNRIEIRHLPFEILNHQRIKFDNEETENAVKAFARKSNSGRVKNPAEEGNGCITVKLKDAAAEAEYEVIMAALNKAKFNRSKAADLLGIDRKTLYNKMKQMKLIEK